MEPPSPNRRLVSHDGSLRPGYTSAGSELLDAGPHGTDDSQPTQIYADRGVPSADGDLWALLLRPMAARIRHSALDPATWPVIRGCDRRASRHVESSRRPAARSMATPAAGSQSARTGDRERERDRLIAGRRG